ncbi:MAG: NAD-dependent epimerase/dehydratase family protein [Polyangiaceae bacterium]|nr:NAD-dependent epimerase/dehydratase family protein [Polyangiaceae bacterium]
MTVLVTGGSGFLGSHIVEQLSRAGRPVRALVRKTSDTRFLRSLPGVELAEGAVEDRDSFVRAAAGVTAIVHSAGLVKARSPEEFDRVNVGGTENALEAARAATSTLRRFVLVSSLAAAGPSDEQGNPVKVGAETAPVTHYGRSKRRGERKALEARAELPITVIRPPTIYGPRDQELLAAFKSVRARVMPYFGSTASRLSMIHGTDCAAACVAAIDADVPSGSVYFVDDGAVHTFADVASGIEGALGVRAWLRFPIPRVVVEAVALGAEQYGKLTDRAVMLTRDKCNELFGQWVCDADPARAELGWSARYSLVDGLRETAEWYRANDWL